MLTNIILFLVGAFIGWTFPEPQFMKTFYSKVKVVLTNLYSKFTK